MIRLVLFASLVSYGSSAIAAEEKSVTAIGSVSTAPEGSGRALLVKASLLSTRLEAKPSQPSPGVSLRDVNPQVPTSRWAVSGAALAVGVASLVWGVTTLAGSETACDRSGAPSCGSVLSRSDLGAERVAAGAVITLAAAAYLVRLSSEAVPGATVSVGPKGQAAGGHF
jgi:hypothetical protein